MSESNTLNSLISFLLENSKGSPLGISLPTKERINSLEYLPGFIQAEGLHRFRRDNSIIEVKGRDIVTIRMSEELPDELKVAEESKPFKYVPLKDGGKLVTKGFFSDDVKYVLSNRLLKGISINNLQKEFVQLFLEPALRILRKDFEAKEPEILKALMLPPTNPKPESRLQAFRQFCGEYQGFDLWKLMPDSIPLSLRCFAIPSTFIRNDLGEAKEVAVVDSKLFEKVLSEIKIPILTTTEPILLKLSSKPELPTIKIRLANGEVFSESSISWSILDVSQISSGLPGPKSWLMISHREEAGVKILVNASQIIAYEEIRGRS